MSNNIREQLMAKTANLPTPADFKDGGKKDKGGRGPQTMPGITSALAAAQLRIQELESKGVDTEIAVGTIVPNPWQPRRQFNEAKLSELARSIAEAGLLQAVTVRRVGETFQLVAGERRWRAHKLLNRDSIRAVVIECTDQDMAAYALMENVTRDDLSDYEIAIAVRRAESEFPNRTRLAEVMGVTRNELYKFLAFDDLPDFVKRDLDLNPSVLGANSAQDIANVLKKTAEPGLKALKELWPLVLSGDLVQTKIGASITAQVSRGLAASDAGGRSILKIFAGKVQAGSITKDVKGLTFKFKAGVMTEEQENELREHIGKMFSVRPE
ncbi:ParB/RepB/Spo0J family partition protein [Paraburkholderia caribensis]|uniref:ParB-like partition protein n=2 Tax=Paraburkholderia TaxID=1822464 RepID=B2JXX5_PARP8|nr:MULTISPECIES: ParB/RepB/Spo0J family partition protein [Paraburkholderia]ACC76483.1 parB-like partition protein [Paraburkholderia phymatum STM815]MCO4879351.1 ParB/RepB/Spo0J family partition protein [Paraburkholderia caribensis]PTB24015.1 ParB/RepB/Spo0J family partition protein [Paraburkholderia caribensis]